MKIIPQIHSSNQTLNSSRDKLQPPPASPRFRVDWVVLNNELTDPRPDGRATLKVAAQGYDRDGILAELARPFRTADINISNFSFRVFGEDRCYYDARIVAQDRIQTLDFAKTFFNRRPIAYSHPVAPILTGTSAVLDHPHRIDVRISVADQPRVIASVAEAVASSVTGGGPFSTPADASDLYWAGGSFARFQGRIYRFEANESNDADFPFSGVPGFIIDAEIAAVSPAHRDQVIESLRTFVSHQELAWCRIQQLDSAPARLFDCQLVRDHGSKERCPTHFSRVAPGLR